MDIFLKIILLTGFIIPILSHDIEIIASGLSVLQRDEMLMRFFVTLFHHGRQTRNVFVHMVECCENLSEEDIDCESIRLHDDYIRIAPGMTRNLTLVHPNIYVYNRKGSCLLSIWHRIPKEEQCDDKPTELRHRLNFDTSVKTTPQDVLPVMRNYYDPQSVSKCETRDLDPFDDCNPVDCNVKYSGSRNYYNSKRKRCQKVPVCIADPRKELPDIVYVPTSNTCRDLEKIVSEGDIADLVNGKVSEPDKELESCTVNIQCHHGEIDPKTGLCICDYGWKSEPFDPDSGCLYHMCNLKCRQKNKKFPLIPFLIGLFIALWMILCVCFCEKYQLACQFMRKIAHGDENCACMNYMQTMEE